MAEAQVTTADKVDVEKVVGDILNVIDREREREIISRRFGLFDRKETLEQIGELLSITRERVRQLEKSVVAKLRQNVAELPHISEVEEIFTKHLKELGNVARVSTLTEKVVGKDATKIDQSRVSFLAQLAPNLSVVDDNDHFFHAVGLKAVHTEQQIKDHVSKIIDAIKKLGKPAEMSTIDETVKHGDAAHLSALASTSKHLATLHNQWGLVKWPMVNPKNIRDKIYVILQQNGKPMHFSEIAGAIKDSSFKRKDVTTQAIHNELIKDKRFVLIGRGIYALKEWGYEKGTVADIIVDVLKEAKEPLHRDEIVKRVLKHRFVKETTILLNLQGKSQFKRVAKATYALADEK